MMVNPPEMTCLQAWDPQFSEAYVAHSCCSIPTGLQTRMFSIFHIPNSEAERQDADISKHQGIVLRVPQPG